MLAVDILAGGMLLWTTSVLGLSVLEACQTPAILNPVPPDPDARPGCLLTEHACVEGEPAHATGFCCLESYACGGGFPNIGCESGYCCPTRSGYVEGKKRMKQRPAQLPAQ